MKPIQNKSYEYIILGAGLPSLICARFLLNARKSVIIVDPAEHPGGLFYPVHHNGSLYDDAMHIVYTTLQSHIDQILFDWAEKYRWIELRGWEKDLAGHSHDFKIYESSPNIDLRNKLTKGDTNEILAELCSRSAPTTPFINASVKEGIAHHFGKKLGATLESIIEGKFGSRYLNSASDSLRLNDLRRVLIGDYNPSDYSKLPDSVRSVIGFHDQRKLPPNLQNNQIGFYPSQFTWKNTIDLVREELAAGGVKFYLSTKPTTISKNKSGEFVVDMEGNGERFSETSRFLVSTIGQGIKTYFQLEEKNRQHNPAQGRKRTAVRYYELDAPDERYLNYYYFDYNPSIKTYRTTFYNNYSKALSEEGRAIISQELWFEDSDATPIDDIDRDIDELHKTGIMLRKKSIVNTNIITRFRPEFPVYSDLESSINGVSEIEQQCPGLVCAGILTSRDSLLLPGVIRNLFSKIEKVM